MPDGIGAGEAGRLLAEAVTAETESRLSKSAAGLEIIDGRLPVGVRKAGMFGRRHVGAGRASDGDSVRCVLLASLIDSVSGGDPERLRGRLVMARTGWKGRSGLT